MKKAAPDAAFALLLGAAVITGGGAALAGLPKFLEAALPGMTAQASPGEGATKGVAHLTLPDGETSRYAPQVLYPLTENPWPQWLRRTAVSDSLPPAHPLIAICIDDLGEDLAGTDRAMALPKAVALSFLPFAEATPFLAESAARRGHLVLAHVPMEAVGGQNPGPMTLKTGMNPVAISQALGWHLAHVPGLAGINNHEGSRFTADAAALAPVMATLKARHLFFFDSRTGPDSQVATMAARDDVMTAARDIFLDDDQSPAAIRAQLAALVATARRNGVAIAIGHPHDATLTVLAAWLKQDHGATLVPLDEAVRRKAGQGAALAAR